MRLSWRTIWRHSEGGLIFRPVASSIVPKTKILVVGNSMPERGGIALALRRRGFSVPSVSTFELKFATALEQPDLVLVDVERLNAQEVTTLLKEGASGFQVVLFADRRLSELRDLAASCRAAWYFRKPPTADEVVTVVETFLGRKGLESRREAVDFVTCARESTRSQFVASCSFPFLIGTTGNVARSRRPRTAAVLDPDVLRQVVRASWQPPAMLALPVCKATDSPLEWITVGRAPESDIVIEHATLSNIHAHFLPKGGGLQLADAGSLNGTWVGGRLLEPNGPPSPILESGDVVRFGELEFAFVTPNVAWDRLRVNVR